MRHVRRAAKRDESEPEIVMVLQAAGAQVWRLDQPADLLVRFREAWHVLEIKTGRGKRGTVARDKRQKTQRDFLAATRTPIVRTPIEALQAIGAMT